MDIARRAAQMSYAKRMKVGAIIVKDDRILADSWNGTPRGDPNNCETTLDDGSLVTLPSVLHAEENCIYKLARSGESGLGATIFCTHEPCIQCAKAIYQTGIKEVVYDQPYRIHDGINFLRLHSITVHQEAEYYDTPIGGRYRLLNDEPGDLHTPDRFMEPN
jgi:dCMP deaminase